MQVRSHSETAQRVNQHYLWLRSIGEDNYQAKDTINDHVIADNRERNAVTRAREFDSPCGY